MAAWRLEEWLGPSTRLLVVAPHPDEVIAKRRALRRHESQVLMMAYYLFSFARANEMFAQDDGLKDKMIRVRCCEAG